MKSTWRANLLRDARIPLIVLVVCILAFGLLTPVLGFYWDDWLVIFHAQTDRTADLVTLYSYDRPLSVWTALISINLLGVSPLNWHLFALIIRFLAVLAMWWAMRALWPRQAKRLVWAALFFAIYPAYYLQPISVAFSQHWIAYGLFFVSLGAMGWALRRPENFRAYTLLSLLTAALHMVTIEYFAGLELIRPLYLHILISQDKGTLRQNALKILRVWWPYFFLWGVWAIWRLFFLELPAEPHTAQLLLDFQANPLETALAFVELVIQSYVHILWSTWQQLLGPELFDFQNRFQLFAWAIGLLTSVALFFSGKRILDGRGDVAAGQEMAKWIMALGIAAIFFGLLPTWLIGKTSLESGYGERFALPALFGAALVWAGFIWLFIENKTKRRIVFAVLIGLAVASHVRASNNFRWDWQKQQSFYAQLSWRVPAVRPGTAILSFNRLSEFMPNSSTSTAINMLYPQSRPQTAMDVWAFELERTLNVKVIQQKGIFESNYRGMLFEAEDSESLLFTYQPEGGCLWVLTPLHAANDYVPFEHRALLFQANIDRILADDESEDYPPKAIFGSLEPEGWCYYYQRAELALQLGRWQEVLDLHNEAEEQGHNANYSVERLSLVKAYARLGNWEMAAQVSEEILAKHVRNTPMLCALWGQFSEDGLLDGAGLAAWQNVQDLVGCEAD